MYVCTLGLSRRRLKGSFSKPSLATWSNYDALFHNSGLVGAVKTTAYIAVGNTLLVVLLGAWPATHSRGSSSWPRLALHRDHRSVVCRSRWR